MTMTQTAMASPSEAPKTAYIPPINAISIAIMAYKMRLKTRRKSENFLSCFNTEITWMNTAEVERTTAMASAITNVLNAGFFFRTALPC